MIRVHRRVRWLYQDGTLHQCISMQIWKSNIDFNVQLFSRIMFVHIISNIEILRNKVHIFSHICISEDRSEQELKTQSIHQYVGDFVDLFVGCSKSTAGYYVPKSQNTFPSPSYPIQTGEYSIIETLLRIISLIQSWNCTNVEISTKSCSFCKG